MSYSDTVRIWLSEYTNIRQPRTYGPGRHRPGAPAEGRRGKGGVGAGSLQTMDHGGGHGLLGLRPNTMVGVQRYEGGGVSK